MRNSFGVEYVLSEEVAKNKYQYNAIVSLFRDIHSFIEFIDISNVDMTKWAISEGLITFHEARTYCASFESYVRNLQPLG